MSKIKILDSNIYNKISAGEVVERPSSVVKELVENSIDAGANHIIVEITNGGLRSIKITDNGSGIDREDIKTAFLPHATSKLTSAEDLFAISTLGFRGEALASIASVSMIVIKSKTSSAASGYMLELKGGVITNEQPCSSNNGTIIEVSNIFYNTPARLKFMKKPKSEEGYVRSIVEELILANPYVAIELFTDNIRVFSSVGDGLFNAISAIYDNSITNNLLPLSYDKGSYRINGYIGNKALSKSNRTYQTIIINGRVISNQVISSAAAKAYGSAMMSRCYPVFVLDITMPFDMVDVNVHPSKAEVRFRDSSIMYGIVYSAINRTLNSVNDFIPELVIDNNDKDYKEEIAKEIASDLLINKTYTSYIQPKANNNYDKSKFIDIITESSRRTKILSENEGISAQILNNIFKQEQIENKITYQDIIKPDSNEYKVIGQIFNTYLMIEYNSDAFIIDQHAAMEKINYDRLIDNIDNENLMQPLLIPYILNTNNYESDFVMNNLNAYKSIGIDIETFGNNSYRVNTVPAMLSDIDLEQFFKLSIGELLVSIR